MSGAEEVDLAPGICRKRCFGVSRNVLTYRDNEHLTATFARRLAPWLGRGVDRARGR